MQCGIAFALRLRLDKAGLGRSIIDADFATMGLGSACARASHDRLCSSTPCCYQTGRRPLGLGAEDEAKMRRHVVNPWTPEDEARLRALAASGRSAATIAERLKRPVSAIRYKARALNIMLRRVGHLPKSKG